ncbi:hypothetical protein ACWEWK_22535 [Streptomyces sp. NPDC003757]
MNWARVPGTCAGRRGRRGGGLRSDRSRRERPGRPPPPTAPRGPDAGPPPGFVCETTGGGDCTGDDVPGYVNPFAAVLALAAVASAVRAGYASAPRARAAAAGDRAPDADEGTV